MFERFTDRARRVVVLAQQEARRFAHNAIGTEHLLLGLISEGEGVAAQVLQALDVSLDEVRAQVESIIGRGDTTPPEHMPFTPRAKKVLELSLRESLNLGHNYIGSEHILLGLVREGEGVAARVLVLLGADLNRVRQETIALLSGRAAPEPGSRRAFWRRRRMAGAAPGDVAYESEPAGTLGNGLERLTDGVLQAVLGARAEVRRLGAPELGPEHLLAGLLLLGDDPAATALQAAGVTPEGVRGALGTVTESSGEGGIAVPALAPGAWQALASAELHATAAPLDTIALLTALLEVSAAARLLVTSAGGDLDGLRAALPGEESTGG